MTIAPISSMTEARNARFWNDFRVAWRPTAERIRNERNSAAAAARMGMIGGSAATAPFHVPFVKYHAAVSIGADSRGVWRPAASARSGY